MSGLGIEPPFVMHFWGGGMHLPIGQAAMKGLANDPSSIEQKVVP